MIENTNMPGGWTDLNNADINELVDKNYGQRLKSGDNTTLRYEITEGDLEPIDLNGKTAEAVMLHDGVVAYRTPARLDPDNQMVFFHIDRALAPSATPYQVEIIVTDPTKREGEADHTRWFPSSHDNKKILLTITPSSANSDSAIIETIGDQKLRTIVLERLDELQGLPELDTRAWEEAEQERQRKEQERLSAEEGRLTAEKGRVEAEQGRVEAEVERNSKEQERLNAEKNRVEAEQARTEREDERSESEQNRQTQEQKRTQSESARASAEKARAESERVRTSKESERQSSESARREAEQERLKEEMTRKSAESQRVGAEEERALSENDRQSKYQKLVDQANQTMEQINKATANFGLYTAGDGITIDDDGKINANIDLSVLNAKIDEPAMDGEGGQFLMTDGAGGRTWETVETTDTTYTAGKNIQISPNNEISATDTNTTYSAGENINIDKNNRISAIDTVYDDTDLRSLINGKADADHHHDDRYAKLGHKHPEYLTENDKYDDTAIRQLISGKADVDHTHSEYVTADEVADLVPDVDLYNYYTKEEYEYSLAALAGLYAPIDHKHEIDHVNGLQANLDSKTDKAHTHSISDISNLQSQLDSKASSTHSHDDRYSKIGHTHSEYMLKNEAVTFNVVEMTESQYIDLETKDPNTLYILREG